MRVVWQRKKTSGPRSRIRLTAVLVMEDGDRKKVVTAPLCSIEERFLETRIRCTREFHQGLFWISVDRYLDTLGLEQHSRNALEKEISQRVPRPGDQWALWGVTCIPHFDSP